MEPAAARPRSHPTADTAPATRSASRPVLGPARREPSATPPRSRRPGPQGRRPRSPGSRSTSSPSSSGPEPSPAWAPGGSGTSCGGSSPRAATCSAATTTSSAWRTAWSPTSPVFEEAAGRAFEESLPPSDSATRSRARRSISTGASRSPRTATRTGRPARGRRSPNLRLQLLDLMLAHATRGREPDRKRSAFLEDLIDADPYEERYYIQLATLHLEAGNRSRMRGVDLSGVSGCWPTWACNPHSRFRRSRPYGSSFNIKGRPSAGRPPVRGERGSESNSMRSSSYLPAGTDAPDQTRVEVPASKRDDGSLHRGAVPAPPTTRPMRHGPRRRVRSPATRSPSRRSSTVSAGPPSRAATTG